MKGHFCKEERNKIAKAIWETFTPKRLSAAGLQTKQALT